MYCSTSLPMVLRSAFVHPKIKFYIEVKGKMESAADYLAADAAATKKIEDVRKSLGI